MIDERDEEHDKQIEQWQEAMQENKADRERWVKQMDRFDELLDRLQASLDQK